MNSLSGDAAGQELLGIPFGMPGVETETSRGVNRARERDTGGLFFRAVLTTTIIAGIAAGYNELPRIRFAAKQWVLTVAGDDPRCIALARRLDPSESDLKRITESAIELFKAKVTNVPCGIGGNGDGSSPEQKGQASQQSSPAELLFKAEDRIEAISFSEISHETVQGANGIEYLIYKLPKVVIGDRFVSAWLGINEATFPGQNLPEGAIAVFPQLGEMKAYLGYDPGSFKGAHPDARQIIAWLPFTPDYPPLTADTRSTDKIGNRTGKLIGTGAIPQGRHYLCVDRQGKLTAEAYDLENVNNLSGKVTCVVSLWEIGLANGGLQIPSYLLGTAESDRSDLTQYVNSFYDKATGTFVPLGVSGPLTFFRAKSPGQLTEPFTVPPYLIITRPDWFREIVMTAPFSDGSLPGPETLVFAGDLRDYARSPHPGFGRQPVGGLFSLDDQPILNSEPKVARESNVDLWDVIVMWGE